MIRFMRIRLSTALLLVAVIAVAIGWIIDQKLRTINEEAIVNRERIHQKIKHADLLGRQYISKSIAPPRFVEREAAEIELVSAIFCLWKNKNVYISPRRIYGFLPSELKTRSFLAMLECDSPESFREYAKSLYPYMTEADQASSVAHKKRWIIGFGVPDNVPTEEKFPQLYDETSKEYISFENFLSRALRLDNAEQ